MKSELFKIFLTSGLTIFGGLFIYVIGQLISKFFIEPIHKQSRCIGEIYYSLIFYADLYGNPDNDSKEERNEAKRKLRGICRFTYGNNIYY